MGVDRVGCCASWWGFFAKTRRESEKSETMCVSVGGCSLPEQGDGRGGGEGEVDKPIAAFNCRGSVRYSKAKSVCFSFSKTTFISVIECNAARGPGPGLGDPPEHVLF